MLLLSVALASCDVKTISSAQTSPSTAQASGTAVNAAVPASYQLTAKGQRSTDGFNRYTVTLSGGNGPTTARLPFDLPQGAEIMATSSDSGVVRAQGAAALVFSIGATSTLSFDVKGMPAGSHLGVTLAEAASGGQTATNLMTVIADAPGDAVSLAALPAQTDEQFGTYLKKAAGTGRLIALDAASFTLPTTIDRAWLAFEPGDLNKDGKVNLDDLLLLSSALQGKSKLDDSQKYLAELKDDGQITSADLGLLVAKYLAKVLKVNYIILTIHPSKLTVSDTAQTSVIGNASNGPLNLRAKSDAPWLGLNPVKDTLSPAVIAFEAYKLNGIPKDTSSTITIMTDVQSKTIAVQGVRTVTDSTVDSEAAGNDVDKNGIRDDIDEVIAHNFQETPKQTLYAQREAVLLQKIATTSVYTKEDALAIQKALEIAGTCVLKYTPLGNQYKTLSLLESDTFNNVIRIKNEQAYDSIFVNYKIDAPDDSICE